MNCLGPDARRPASMAITIAEKLSSVRTVIDPLPGRRRLTRHGDADIDGLGGGHHCHPQTIVATPSPCALTSPSRLGCSGFGVGWGRGVQRANIEAGEIAARTGALRESLIVGSLLR
jgi:hypothetical protein